MEIKFMKTSLLFKQIRLIWRSQESVLYPRNCNLNELFFSIFKVLKFIVLKTTKTTKASIQIKFSAAFES